MPAVRSLCLLLVLLACNASTALRVVPADGGADDRDARPPDAPPAEDLDPLAAGEPHRVFPGARLGPIVWTPEDGTASRERGVTEDSFFSVSGFDDDRFDLAGAYVDEFYEGRRCDVRAFERGELPRCVPPTRATRFAFEDRACQARLSVAAPCDDELALVLAPPFGPLRLLAREGPVAVDAVFAPAGGCTEVSREAVGWAPDAEVFRWAPVPSAELVRLASVQREADAPGAVVVERRFTDGTVEQAREPESPCWVRLTSEGYRCLPQRAFPVGRVRAFADPECTEVAYDVAGDPGLIFAIADDAGVPALFELIEQREGNLYERDAGGCMPVATRRAFRFALSASADLSANPRLTPTPVGEGRLRPVRWLDEGGRAWSALPVSPDLTLRDLGNGAYDVAFRWGERFFDTELGVECTPWETPTGPRCLPSLPLSEVGAWVSGSFRDASCSEPIVFRVLPPAGLTDRPTRYVYEAEDGEPTVPGSCGAPAPVTVRPLEGELTTVAAVYSEGPSGCLPSAFRNVTVLASAIGEPVPLERFAAFRED